MATMHDTKRAQSAIMATLGTIVRWNTVTQFEVHVLILPGVSSSSASPSALTLA